MTGRVGAALLALAMAGVVAPAPAQACVAASHRAVVEFAEGSAELDAADEAELAAALRAAGPGFAGWRLTVRAFADRAGAFEPQTWAEADLALAQARVDALKDAILRLGGPPPDAASAVGVAPTGAETRTGADGTVRRGRAVAVLEPHAAPRVDDGRPVPTC